MSVVCLTERLPALDDAHERRWLPPVGLLARLGLADAQAPAIARTDLEVDDVVGALDPKLRCVLRLQDVEAGSDGLGMLERDAARGVRSAYAHAVSSADRPTCVAL